MELLGPPAGNQIRDPTNLAQCSANWATKAVTESLAMIEFFIYL